MGEAARGWGEAGTPPFSWVLTGFQAEAGGRADPGPGAPAVLRPWGRAAEGLPVWLVTASWGLSHMFPLWLLTPVVV